MWDVRCANEAHPRCASDIIPKPSQTTAGPGFFDLEAWWCSDGLGTGFGWDFPERNGGSVPLHDQVLRDVPCFGQRCY